MLGDTLRRSKSPFLSAVLFSSLVAAGCAAHPERPAAPPVHAEAKAATPPAHLFDGCAIMGATPAGYYLRCDSMLAATATQPATTPKAALAISVAAFTKPFPKGSVTTTQEPMTIGGRTFTATRAVATMKVKGHTGTFTQRFVAFQTADDLTVVLMCGGVLQSDLARCPGVLAWLLDHPTTPPPIADQSGATTWPPADLLAIPSGCNRETGKPGSLNISCPDAVITIVRLNKEPLGKDAYERSADQAVKRALRVAKGNSGTGIKAARYDCKVGGKPAACRRIDVTSPQGNGVLVLGVGELFESTSLVMCLRPDTGTPLPADCASFISLGAPLAKPAVAPAAGGSSATP